MAVRERMSVAEMIAEDIKNLGIETPEERGAFYLEYVRAGGDIPRPSFDNYLYKGKKVSGDRALELAAFFIDTLRNHGLESAFSESFTGRRLSAVA